MTLQVHARMQTPQHTQVPQQDHQEEQQQREQPPQQTRAMAALTTPTQKPADAYAPESSGSSDGTDDKTHAASDSQLHTRSTSRLQDYEKLSIIGSGAAAVVHLVRHRASRELFALKVQQISACAEAPADDRSDDSSSNSSSRCRQVRSQSSLALCAWRRWHLCVSWCPEHWFAALKR